MLDADNLSGEPYYISIINQETLPPVDPKGKEKKKMDGVIYNIPGKAQVTVFLSLIHICHRTTPSGMNGIHYRLSGII